MPSQCRPEQVLTNINQNSNKVHTPFKRRSEQVRKKFNRNSNKVPTPFIHRFKTPFIRRSYAVHTPFIRRSYAVQTPFIYGPNVRSKRRSLYGETQFRSQQNAVQSPSKRHDNDVRTEFEEDRSHAVHLGFET
jgi:hypothetical protein